MHYPFSFCLQIGAEGGETSQSEWSEDDDGAASEPLLDQESTGYTTDDPALEQVSMMNDAGLTDAEGKYMKLQLIILWVQT